MKRLYILLLLLAVTSVAQAQDDYQPLVREGVRWIYCESSLIPGDPDLGISNFYAYEFRGDTLYMPELSDSCYRYMKLYRYPVLNNTVSLDFQIKSVENKPYQFLRENNKKVYTLGENFYQGAPSEIVANGDVLYDFSEPGVVWVRDWYSNQLKSVPYSSTVYIRGEPCCVFDSKILWNHEIVLHNTIIEGVGYVEQGGDLLSPNPERIENTGMSTTSFVCLEDLDGNVLYYNDSSDYQFYINTLFRYSDLTGDGRVDVADINAAIDVVVGKAENGKADINGDGRVDIADVNTVVNVILNAR